MSDLTKDETALAMLAAWLNVRVDQIPPENRAHLNPYTMAAWKRVALAAESRIEALERQLAEAVQEIEQWQSTAARSLEIAQKATAELKERNDAAIRERQQP